MPTNLLREGYTVGGGKEALVAANMGLSGNQDKTSSQSDDSLESGSVNVGHKGEGTMEMGKLETYTCGQKRPLRDETPLLQDGKKQKKDQLPCLMQAEMVKTPNCSFENDFDTIKVSDSFFERPTLDQESTYLPPFDTSANGTTSQSRPFSLEHLIEATSSKDSQATKSSGSEHDMFHQPAQLSAHQPYQATTFDQGLYSAMLQLPTTRSLSENFSENLNWVKIALLKDINTTSSEDEKVQKICTLQAWAKCIATRPLQEE